MNAIDTSSEAWRHECEARYVASKPTRQARAEYLDAIRRRRGDAHADRLRDAAARIWWQDRTPHPKGQASASRIAAALAAHEETPARGSFPTAPPRA